MAVWVGGGLYCLPSNPPRPPVPVSLPFLGGVLCANCGDFGQLRVFSYCDQYFLSYESLRTMDGIISQITSQLHKVGILQKDGGGGGGGKGFGAMTLAQANRNGGDYGAIEAALVCGLYPNIAVPVSTMPTQLPAHADLCFSFSLSFPRQPPPPTPHHPHPSLAHSFPSWVGSVGGWDDHFDESLVWKI